MKEKHPREWFKVNKKIKRDALSCPCADCSKPNEFTIDDEDHAEYLFMLQHELDIEYYE